MTEGKNSKSKSQENKFSTIVELLQKKYLSKNEDSFKDIIGKIEIDFISQGFTSSQGLAHNTGCISEQLQANFDYIDALINYVITSLKQDFASMPLSNVEEKLFTIVDEEYKKLILFANRYLVNTGLGEPRNLGRFEQIINRNKEKTKQAIGTELALLEKKKSHMKPPENGKKHSGDTLYDRAIKRLKNNPVICVILICVAILAGLALTISSCNTINDSWFKPNLSPKQEMDVNPTSHKALSEPIPKQTMTDSPGGIQVAGDLYINETENTRGKAGTKESSSSLP